MNISKFQKQFKRNPLLAGFVGIGIISFIFSIPSLYDQQEISNRLRAKRDAAKYKSIELTLDNSIAQANAQLAKKMLADGCAIALDVDDPTKYVEIREGQKAALPNGKRVCSRSGSVGTIVNGRISGIVSDQAPEDIGENHKRVFNGSVKLEK